MCPKKFAHWLVALTLFLLPNLASASKATITLDVLFEPNSAVVARHYTFIFEQVVCKLAASNLELIIAIGHTDKFEKQAESLGLRRAQAVNKILADLGVEERRLYSDSKGAKQPVADNQTLEGQAKNRRVEMEAVHVRLKPVDNSAPSCELPWPDQLLSLSAEKSQVLAKALVVDGRIKPDAPFLLAIQANRADMLATLLKRDSGIHLNRTDRREVFYSAAANGNADLIRLLVQFGIRVREMESSAHPLLKFACNGAVRKQPQWEQGLQELLAWGARPNLPSLSEYETPLGCAASEGNQRMVDILLAAGADPRKSKAIVIRASGSEALVKQLIAAGGNPLEKDRQGLGLFHVFKLKRASDIEWLLSLGLDINEPTKHDGAPLRWQLPTASVEVLDAMVQAGAVFDTKDAALLRSARQNYPALIWLIRKGIALDKEPGLFPGLVSDGEKAIPVLTAMLEAGANINARNHQRRTALAVAIANSKTELALYLLKAGADTKAVEPDVSAIEFAEQLPVPKNSFCIGPFGISCKVEPLPPEEYARRLAAKAAMVELLRNAEQITVPAPGA